MGLSSATMAAAAVVLLLGVLGALAAVSAWIMEAPLRAGELAGLLIADAGSAAVLSVYVRLRTARDAMRVAGLAGAAGILAFFGMSFLLGADAGGLPSGDELRMLLGLAPVSAAMIASGGAGYLARGLRRARTERFPT